MGVERMTTGRTNKRNRLLPLLPVLLGLAGLLASVSYQAQRSGVFLHSFYWIDRFIQHHLDAVAGYSSLAALLGITAGLLIRRFQGVSHLVTFGILFSVGVLLWSTFGLSL